LEVQFALLREQFAPLYQQFAGSYQERRGSEGQIGFDLPDFQNLVNLFRPK